MWIFMDGAFNQVYYPKYILNFFLIKSVASSSQGSCTGQLDFYN